MTEGGKRGGAVVHWVIVLSWQQFLVHCGQNLAVWVFLVDSKETWEPFIVTKIRVQDVDEHNV